MAKYVLKNCGLFLGAYDLSDAHNSIALVSKTKTVDSTVFGDTYQTNCATVPSVDLTDSGYWDGTTGSALDAGLIAISGTQAAAATLLPSERTTVYGTNTPALIFKPTMLTYTPVSGGIGEMRKFTLTAGGWGSLYRGTLLHYGTETATTGNGTAFAIGAASATQKLYATLHFYGDDCSSLIVTIESDNLGTFGSPATQITFATTSAISSEWKELGPGAISDTWYRVTWSFSGTSAGFAVALAIF